VARRSASRGPLVSIIPTRLPLEAVRGSDKRAVFAAAQCNSSKLINHTRWPLVTIRSTGRATRISCSSCSGEVNRATGVARKSLPDPDSVERLEPRQPTSPSLPCGYFKVDSEKGRSDYLD
jgi:hypothetical protein